LNYRIFARVESLLWEEPGLRYDAVEPSDNRRCIMAIAVQQIRPLAHLPLILGVLRRLEVATIKIWQRTTPIKVWVNAILTGSLRACSPQDKCKLP
jgi:hypothetical protein